MEVIEGATVVECEYCGTKQTVPTSQDEEIRNLFNRANALRRRGEFDKAEQIYERILTVDAKQSEAYWGVLLCRYGIEYVEDPKTDKRVPTCHRTSFEAITSDEYYVLALQYADPVQKKLYEEEAKYIDGIQRDILAISQKEEPYDVFICYKETDENGKRTQDSAIANDIYYQLTQEGYKVFYAAITLEDKLGSAYEPIIFAALNSAKVMLAIGTKQDYFNAIWVKNEWSRYLKMMKTDKSKQLIPCYRDMDAYDLPEEFAHLQAQDMGKIGFINDLIRGIKKIIHKGESKTEHVPSDMSISSNLRNLIKRAYLDLESKNFKSAQVQFDKMQDIDPENGEVYLIGLLCDLHLSRLEDLEECTADFSANLNLMKARRFADPALKTRLEQILELNQKYKKYVDAKSSYNTSELDDDEVYKKTLTLLTELGNYRDSAALLEGLPRQKDAILVAKLKEIYGGTYKEILNQRIMAEKLIAKIAAVEIREQETAAWKKILQEANDQQEAQRREMEKQRREMEEQRSKQELTEKIQNCDDAITSLYSTIVTMRSRMKTLDQESIKASTEYEAQLTKIKKAQRGAIIHAVGIAFIIIAIFILILSNAISNEITPPAGTASIVMMSLSIVPLIVGLIVMMKNDMNMSAAPSSGKILICVILNMFFFAIVGIAMMVTTNKYAGKEVAVRIQQECADNKANCQAEIQRIKKEISLMEQRLGELKTERARLYSELKEK